MTSSNEILHYQQAWKTDLVKVFLFKDGHRLKYQRLIKSLVNTNCTTDLEYKENFTKLAENFENICFISIEKVN